MRYVYACFAHETSYPSRWSHRNSDLTLWNYHVQKIFIALSNISHNSQFVDGFILKYQSRLNQSPNSEAKKFQEIVPLFFGLTMNAWVQGEGKKKLLPSPATKNSREHHWKWTAIIKALFIPFDSCFFSHAKKKPTDYTASRIHALSTPLTFMGYTFFLREFLPFNRAYNTAIIPMIIPIWFATFSQRKKQCTSH